MKHVSLIIVLALTVSFLGFSSARSPKPSSSAELDAVLKKMDTVAANFHTTQANFEWNNYQKVIDEMIDVETGVIYYRRSGKEIEMMAEVKQSGTSLATLKPEPKFVLLSHGKVRMYQP